MPLFPLLFLLLLLSCAPAPSAVGQAMLPSQGQGPKAVPAPGLPASDYEEISALLAETLRVLRLPAFDRNLTSGGAEFGRIAQSPFGKRLPAATVANMILGRTSDYSFYPAEVKWKNQNGASVANAGSIQLSNSVRENWRASAPRQRSLAINSMAHELSHTLSSCPDRLCLVFADRGFSFGWLRGNPPVASYMIGSVAQCTWLQEQGQLAEEFAACLKRYGVSSFTP